MSDFVDFFLDCKAVETGHRKAQEQTDPAVEHKESVTKRLFHLFFCALHRCWIRNAPMCSHRLARPKGADFFRSVVTDGKNKVESGSIRLREVIPTLASETVGWQTSALQLFDRFRSDFPRRVAPGTICSEVRSPLVIHDGFGHDRTGGIAGA